jgi:glutathione peroxidase
MDTARAVRKILEAGCWLMLCAAAGRSAAADKPAAKPAAKPEKTVYDYSLVSFDKKEVPLSSFKGKVLLIVNLASQSIFRDQIAQLDDVQKAYKDKGLIVIGVPCNDFGAQEPGSDADVQKIYGDLHLTFQVFARSSVRGKDQAALYSFLTSDKGPAAGDVHWSFTKFLVDRTGKVVARFEPHIAPNAPEVQLAIEQVLEGTFKPTPKGGDEEKKDSGRDAAR